MDHEHLGTVFCRCGMDVLALYQNNKKVQINTLRPTQNGYHFADDMLNYNFLNENVWIPIEISLKFVPKGPIDNIPSLVQRMAWRRRGNKPLSEPMMVRLPTHNASFCLNELMQSFHEKLRGKLQRMYFWSIQICQHYPSMQTSLIFPQQKKIQLQMLDSEYTWTVIMCTQFHWWYSVKVSFLQQTIILKDNFMLIERWFKWWEMPHCLYSAVMTEIGNRALVKPQPIKCKTYTYPKTLYVHIYICIT